MATTIQIKRSSTASGVPLATDLAVGELAVNLADKRLFTKQSDGTIIELSTNPTDLDAATLRIDGVEITASATELNSLDGFTGSTTELNLLDGLTATTIELNTLDGITASTAELNKLDGYTGSTAELNILDGVTATTAELNFVDGVTSNIQTQLNNKQPLDAQLTDVAGLTPADGSFIVGNGTNFVAESGDTAIASLGVTATAAELNTLDGITSTTTELNYTDGVTSSIQTQLDGKATTAQGALADSAVQPNDNVSFGTGDFSGAVDVTGTITADGLTVDTGGTAVVLNHSATGPTLRFNNLDQTVADGQQLARIEFSTDDGGSTTDEAYLQLTATGGGGAADFDIMVGDGTPVKRARFGVGGDVSFYEDTGTTAKMVWDASAESLIVGNTVTLAGAKFHVDANGDSPNTVVIQDTNDLSSIVGTYYRTTSEARTSVATGGVHTWYTNGSAGTERMRIDSAGNVGIGEDSPSAKLDVGSAADPAINMSSSADGILRLTGASYSFAIANNDTGTYLYNNGSGRALVFGNNETERARIDSSGNFMVGTTNSNVFTSSSENGFYLTSTGQARQSVNSVVQYLNRTGSDGTIANFAKNGTTVGSIGTKGNRVFISGSGATNSGGLLFTDGGAGTIIAPCDTGGTLTNNSANLGGNGIAFKDLYLSGGVYLGGTGAANKLDDYEEGAWTPTVSSNTAPSTVTHSVQEGYYVKVGKLVTVSFDVQLSAWSGGSSFIFIDDLPFVTHEAIGMGSVSMENVSITSTNYGLAPRSGAQNHLIIRYDRDNNTSTTVLAGVLSGNERFRGSFSYYTDA